MTRFIKTQNSFANGEIAPEFFGHDNISGLSRLENMDVVAGGVLTRRPGLEQVAKLNGTARLIPFSVGEGQDYVLALSNQYMAMYHNGDCVASMMTPWAAAALPQIQYAQRFGTMIFVHPDYEPYVLKQVGGIFELSSFDFDVNGADMSTNIPFMKFDDAANIQITVTSNSAGNNFATFTTSKPYWTQNQVGDTLQLMGRQWTVDEYVSPTVIRAYTNGAYSLPTAPISDWSEAAFGNRRGWPRSITFHQDRLVFGGSRDYPSGVWMSQVGRHNNFNVGTGLDDEAIFITLLSGQRQQIVTIVSSDNLQILTSVGEWAITSRPLTPTSIDVRQHTSVGSIASKNIPPQCINGKTVFISATQKDIRELELDALGETYNATDLCAYAKHLMNSPIDMAYNDATHKLHIVTADGQMAVLNHNSGLNISAWGRYKTDGNFCAVAVAGNDTYAIVMRDDEYWLEKFSETKLTDGPDYGFSCWASGLPMRASGHNIQKLRIYKIMARVQDTKSVFINNARATLSDGVYDDGAPGFTGDVSISTLGTIDECINSPWSIHTYESLPITVLSVTMYGNYIV